MFCVLNVWTSDIYFIGGFGTVAWVDVNEYENLKPDRIAVDGGEQYLKVNIYSILPSKRCFVFLIKEDVPFQKVG